MNTTEIVITRSFGACCGDMPGLQSVLLIPELAKPESAFLVACNGTVVTIVDTYQGRGVTQELIPPQVLRVAAGVKKVTVTSESAGNWEGLPTKAKGDGPVVKAKSDDYRFPSITMVLPDAPPEHVKIILDARELANAQRDIGDGSITLYVPTGPTTRGCKLPPIPIAGAYGCGILTQTAKEQLRVVDPADMFPRIKAAYEQTRK